MPPLPIVSRMRLVRWAGMLSTVAMLALLAWLGAVVFWSLNTRSASAPPPATLETDPVRAAQTIVTRHLFGEVQAAPVAAAKAPALPDVALRGVIAPSQPGRPGSAILAIGGKPAIAVKAGDEIAPGAKLVRVLPGSVEIEQGAEVKTVSLAERGKAQAPRKEAQPQAASPPEQERARQSRKEAE